MSTESPIALDFQSRFNRLIPDVSKNTMRNNVKMIIGFTFYSFNHDIDKDNRNTDISCFSDSYDFLGDMEHIHSRANHIHEHYGNDNYLNDYLLNEYEQAILLCFAKSMDDPFIAPLLHSF